MEIEPPRLIRPRAHFWRVRNRASENSGQTGQISGCKLASAGHCPAPSSAKTEPQIYWKALCFLDFHTKLLEKHRVFICFTAPMPAGLPNDASEASLRVTLPTSRWWFLLADASSGIHFFGSTNLYNHRACRKCWKRICFCKILWKA